MSFVLPFSITTARVHIVFGVVTVVLVGMHLATRLDYFTRIARQSVAFKDKKNPQVPRGLVAAIVVVWAGLLAASIYNRQPVTGLIDVGYESRHKAEIFRADPKTVYEKVGPTNRVASVDSDPGALLISIEIEYAQPLDKQPAAAVWAQSGGNDSKMIQTLFVDDAVAYSQNPKWNGKATPRHHILPIWRFRYSDVNGIDPTGETDALTQATPSHSFSIEQSIQGQDSAFIVCLEINAHGDTNDAYPDEHLGQPSVWYTARVDPADNQRYYLMTLTAHGGGAEQGGLENYALDELTTAKAIVEKAIVEVRWPEPERE